MKIFACCNWQLKFLGPILDRWRADGHEVEYRLGYDPALHEWANVCFVDVCDHNAVVASRERFPYSRLVIRAIDIECWAGQPGGVAGDNVDSLVFGARHITTWTRWSSGPDIYKSWYKAMYTSLIAWKFITSPSGWTWTSGPTGSGGTAIT
jgi:hypothetical protein